MRSGFATGLALLMGLVGSASMTRADDKAKPADKDKSEKAFDDAEFVKKAASGGMLEVELGKLAAEKGTMPEVKKFGAMMVKDHTKANEELMKVAKANKMAVPEKMMEKDMKMVAKFKKLKGAEFDKAYVMDMVEDHEMDVKEFMMASKEAKNAELSDFATKTLPTLKEHLKMVKDLSEKVK